MPITQTRVLAILAEATAMQQAHTELRQTIKDSITSERQGMIEPLGVQLLSYLAALEAILAIAAVPPMTATAIESYHFRKFGKRNESYKAAARRKRGQDPGVTPSNAPQSLVASSAELHNLRIQTSDAPPIPEHLKSYGVSESSKIAVVKQTVAQSDLDLLTPQELRGLGFDEEELKEMGLVAKPETESDPDT